MGKIVSFEEIEPGHELHEKMTHYRESMMSELANHCEELEELYLTQEINEISSESIDVAVRKAVLSGKTVPLLCGSALKNKGI